jgi:hypothetical protein
LNKVFFYVYCRDIGCYTNKFSFVWLVASNWKKSSVCLCLLPRYWHSHVIVPCDLTSSLAKNCAIIISMNTTMRKLEIQLLTWLSSAESDRVRNVDETLTTLSLIEFKFAKPFFIITRSNYLRVMSSVGIIVVVVRRSSFKLKIFSCLSSHMHSMKNLFLLFSCYVNTCMRLSYTHRTVYNRETAENLFFSCFRNPNNQQERSRYLPVLSKARWWNHMHEIERNHPTTE